MLIWHLSFPLQERAGDRRSPRGRTGELDGWRGSSPGKGHGLRNRDVGSEHQGFRSKCRLAVSRIHAKLFWEVCPKQGKRKAKEPSFKKWGLVRTR